MAHFSSSLDIPAGAEDSETAESVGERLGCEDERYGLVETRRSLAAALLRLPHLEREALSLRINSGMKQTEIAARLGCSQMQVARLLRRAAGRLSALTDPPLGRR